MEMFGPLMVSMAVNPTFDDTMTAVLRHVTDTLPMSLSLTENDLSRVCLERGVISTVSA